MTLFLRGITPAVQYHEVARREVLLCRSIVVGIDGNLDTVGCLINLLNLHPRGVILHTHRTRLSKVIDDTFQHIIRLEGGNVLVSFLAHHECVSAILVECSSLHRTALSKDKLALLSTKSVHNEFENAHIRAHLYTLNLRITILIYLPATTSSHAVLEALRPDNIIQLRQPLGDIITVILDASSFDTLQECNQFLSFVLLSF